ncbi:hypothetical protein CWB41_13085 [Methylovirgula ligni]|jgi:hypothetical protein|uniref:Uncharacterized protein n=1 Tax=Methylovirgula ligni TaxID=569860 RepID=A0A3D9YNK9_9HYPH|nr:hypothetical protein [Methylovirgula ligni]QAY96549.1 hypothetical protein CWB41_13085 [Methylovirgula ligni]REF84147.1 hypothetical protein DES32_2993 [Methylovirgula ligni]
MTKTGARFFALLALLMIALVAARAQDVKPAATPEDPEADSAAAMKFTVHESRKGGDWDMWDIGRPHPMQGKGEFGDNDAIGVAAGKRIPTDCSLYWNDPDTHKILCFSSQASLVYFLDAPQANAARAAKRWREMQKKPAS